jgi:hypothetical protein
MSKSTKFSFDDYVRTKSRIQELSSPILLSPNRAAGAARVSTASTSARPRSAVASTPPRSPLRSATATASPTATSAATATTGSAAAVASTASLPNLSFDAALEAVKVALLATLQQYGARYSADAQLKELLEQCRAVHRQTTRELTETLRASANAELQTELQELKTRHEAELRELKVREVESVRRLKAQQKKETDALILKTQEDTRTECTRLKDAEAKKAQEEYRRFVSAEYQAIADQRAHTVSARFLYCFCQFARFCCFAPTEHLFFRTPSYGVVCLYPAFAHL